MSKKYGFGIVGCGAISKFHVAAINEIANAKLIGVFNTPKSFAEDFAKEYNCRVFDTYEEMLCCEDIDVVNICTPSGTHAPLAIEAANHKKNVIVEKPMAITENEIEELVCAVEKNNIKLAVISQLRFNENIQKVKKAIESGELGDIILGDVYMKYFRSPEYYSSSNWRGTWAMDGGGALMNQGIHGIDILQYLVGPIKTVSAVCKTLARDIEVEDTASLVVEYENGAVGVIQGTTSVEPGYPRVIEITGTKGTVSLTETDITKWDIDGKTFDITDSPQRDFYGFRDPEAIALHSHLPQIKDMIKAIEEDRPPMVDVNEGRKPVEIILAAYESSKLRRQVEIKRINNIQGGQKND